MTVSRSQRVLVVCLGNHCRSPAAAAILSKLGGKTFGSTVEVRSAGLVDKWVGKPAHPAMITAASRRGYDLTDHRGTQVDPNLLACADVVLAMDTEVLTALHGLRPDGLAARVELYLGEGDVPDPWGQPHTAFADCVELIEVRAHHLIATIDRCAMRETSA
jgi:protein-tyrosine phosphatase